MRIFKKSSAKYKGKYILPNLVSLALFGYYAGPLRELMEYKQRLLESDLKARYGVPEAPVEATRRGQSQGQEKQMKAHYIILS